MKLIHLSDLHIGKRVGEVSMLEDQAYILEEILRITDEEAPQAVLIAGDVYDKSVPSAEAVSLFDDFLCRLALRDLPVLLISGNHDSPERLAFGGRLMSGAGVHVSPVYSGDPTPITITDQLGPVDFWLLPFLKPAHVRRFFPEAEIHSYTDALRTAIEALPLDTGRRNVLLTHQFVTGSETCDSEEISVGGTDNVDAAVFDPFDYVALGHLHGPQNVLSQRIRYCGTPLKYSFSEEHHQKSVTVAELGEKGNLTVSTRPLIPRRDMRSLRGTYRELMDAAPTDSAPEDYLHITLTDEEDVPEALGRLRAAYPNLMTLSYDNTRTRTNRLIDGPLDVRRKSPLTLFSELYEKQNNCPLSETQRAYMEKLLDDLWEDRL